MQKQVERWRSDSIAFITEVLVDPQNGAPFSLYAEQRTFLKNAFELTSEGRLRFTEMVFSGGKKSGKTTLAAMMCIFTAVALAGNNGEIYCLANDLEQSQSRVFRAVAQILQASPFLRDSVSITANKIVFRSTGTFIMAVANDYQGFSGANPTMNVYDELAYYTTEQSRRLWDEGVPSPTRRISFRLSVSTAGFEGEPSPLHDLYDRAVGKGMEIAPDLRVHENFLCHWTHECRAPWQSQPWVEEMRRTLRPTQFARLILNQWTSTESSFIELEQWDACVDPQLAPLLGKSGLPIWTGLDLGLKHDSTALVTCAWEGEHIRLVEHRIFLPVPGTTLDIEETAEAAIRSLRARFALQSVYFDPWQGIGLAQRLTRAGVKMIEWPQTLPNLSLMAGNLLELIKRRQLVCYPAADLRQAIAKTVAIEGSRGWRLGKAKAGDRVDPIIALAMAALAAAQVGKPEPLDIRLVPNKRWSDRWDERPTSSRLYARGEDVAAEEDLQDEMKRLRRRRDRFHGF